MGTAGIDRCIVRCFKNYPFITVRYFQAAIGSVSLDIARERGFTGMYQEEFGIQVKSPSTKIAGHPSFVPVNDE